jgi:hypothetical protein
MNNLADARATWYGDDARRDPLFTGGRLENETQYNYYTRHAPRRPSTTYGNALLAARSMGGPDGLGSQSSQANRKRTGSLNETQVLPESEPGRKGGPVAPAQRSLRGSFLSPAPPGSLDSRGEGVREGGRPGRVGAEGGNISDRGPSVEESALRQTNGMGAPFSGTASRQFTHNKDMGRACALGSMVGGSVDPNGGIGVGGGVSGAGFGLELGAPQANGTALSCSCSTCEGADCMRLLPGLGDPVCTRCTESALSGRTQP